MTVVLLDEMMRHLSLTDDMPGDDLVLLEGKIAAAQNHADRLLGFKIEDRYIPDHETPTEGDDREALPPTLKEAVMQLAGWWFENREAVTDAGRVLPFGVSDIINEYREWTF